MGIRIGMHVCIQLYVLFLLQVCMLILANAEVIGKCGHECAQEYVCMCAYVYVHVYEPSIVYTASGIHNIICPLTVQLTHILT